MRILLIADLECIIGIRDQSFLTNADKNYELGCGLLTKQVKIVIDECFKHKIERITICDIHNGGNNLKILDFNDDRLDFINEFHKIDLSIEYNQAFLIGFHGRSHTDGLMSHSFRNDFDEVLLNGAPVGEVTLISYWLMERRIPVTYISGDSYAVEEMKLYQSFADNYVVSHRNESSLDLFYQEFRKTLSATLNKKIPLINSMDKKFEVLIKPISNDLLKYIGDDYVVKNNTIVFQSIDNFFNSLKRISYEFNNYWTILNNKFLEVRNYVVCNFTEKEFLKLVQNNEISDIKVNNICNLTLNDLIDFEICVKKIKGN